MRCVAALVNKCDQGRCQGGKPFIDVDYLLDGILSGQPIGLPRRDTAGTCGRSARQTDRSSCQPGAAPRGEAPCSRTAGSNWFARSSRPAWPAAAPCWPRHRPIPTHWPAAPPAIIAPGPPVSTRVANGLAGLAAAAVGAQRRTMAAGDFGQRTTADRCPNRPRPAFCWAAWPGCCCCADAGNRWPAHPTASNQP